MHLSGSDVTAQRGPVESLAAKELPEPHHGAIALQCATTDSRCSCTVGGFHVNYNQMVVRSADQRLTDDEVDRIFRALADATRRDILRRTLDGEISVSHLAAFYDMSFAAVQKHVAALEEAGLVTKHPHGRERRVRGNPATLQRAQELLGRYEDIWRGRIARLDALLSTE